MLDEVGRVLRADDQIRGDVDETPAQRVLEEMRLIPAKRDRDHLRREAALAQLSTERFCVELRASPDKGGLRETDGDPERAIHAILDPITA